MYNKYFKGFTLVEMLIVIAIIVILISIMIPSLRNAKEYAYDSQCKSNMHRLSVIFKTSSNEKEVGDLPPHISWISFVIRQDATGLLFCPKDRRKHNDNSSGSLDDIYIIQKKGNNYWYSYLKDILSGRDVPDEQILLNPEPTTHRGDHCFCYNWYPFAQRERQDNENIIAMDDDAAVLITEKEDGWLFESLDPEGDTHCSSDHWVCRGDGGEDWQDEILMRLTGRGYKNKIDKPVFIEGNNFSSYGMNNQVPIRGARSNQILLCEYYPSIINALGNGNSIDDFSDTNKYLALRHFWNNMYANVVLVDGSVSSKTLEQLDPSFNEAIWKP